MGIRSSSALQWTMGRRVCEIEIAKTTLLHRCVCGSRWIPICLDVYRSCRCWALVHSNRCIFLGVCNLAGSAPFLNIYIHHISNVGCHRYDTLESTNKYIIAWGPILRGCTRGSLGLLAISLGHLELFQTASRALASGHLRKLQICKQIIPNSTERWGQQLINLIFRKLFWLPSWISLRL